MAAGNKKKKKPAANPARGFATTSTQSKSKIDSVKDTGSTDASGTVTPDKASTPATNEVRVRGKQNANSDRELHELSPDELGAQLEASELQQFVDKHAARVRKEATRQVSRLQTEKRLLRGQADFLSVKDWLPDELMQQILDFSLVDIDHENESTKKPNLHLGDDLVSKVWNLRLVLVDIDISLERANEAIGFLLQRPPPIDSASPLWGLTEALDWLALHCQSGELLEFDAQKRRAILAIDDDATDSQDDVDGESTTKSSKDHDFHLLNNEKESRSSVVDDIDVSDIESDLEPDELLSVYLRTKARLYDLSPGRDDPLTKKKTSKSVKIGGNINQTSSDGERKLHQKLQKIESDVLFDQREADMQWTSKKVQLAQDTAERRKLQLPNGEEIGNRTSSASHSTPDTDDSHDITKEAERLGDELIEENADLEDDADMLGGMFDSLPGMSESPLNGEVTTGSEHSATIRDFGRITGMHPRRVLEEACRSRDSRCQITYKQISPTTYACRHAVVIDWTKEQELFDSSYVPAVSERGRPRQLQVSMVREAAPDISQSEAYVATAALFLIFSGSPKEEKSHMRLPPAYRDLWNGFTQLKRDSVDAQDRETVKELRVLIEKETKSDDDADEEIVFSANIRRLNGAASGSSTPASRPQTPRPIALDASQTLKDIWSRKVATASYQRMLLARMNLPMFHSKAIALEAIEHNQVTIIVGDTGSGKSTQVPQFLLERELSQGRQCKIYCTEPRRISALSLAQRVSEELGEHKGDLGTVRSLVGYAIRLESQTGPQTKLVYATVGIVLRMLEGADGLSEITHLVLDEVHERSIDTDFLLIVLRSLLTKRPNLKVVLMSATVDAQKFSQYLDGAPIISVPGRTFPVQARFLEDAIELTGHTSEEAKAGSVDVEDDGDSDPEDQSKSSQQLTGYNKLTRNTLANYDEYRIDHTLIVKLLEKVAYHPEYQNFSHAILVFLPGIAEIRQLHDMLVGHPSFSQSWRIHALHSSFSSEDQQAAFEIPPNGVRKIVLATNIAETGITIPDVTCVIDTGKHREMRFDERRQMSRLTQSFIARANAKQRRGRAGRVQEGICFHLFTKYRFEELMVDQQTPEMLRLSLQDLVMRVKICKLGDVEHALSEALDPPSSKNIRRAIDALIEVGALTEQEQLTPLGVQLAKLPLDAQLGKLILLGATFGCLDFTLTVAAALSAKSPFLSPMHAKKQADSVRLGYKRGDSDLLTLYNAYSAWRKVCTTPGLSEFQFCNKNFLSPQNLANIEDLKAQLLTSLVDAGFVTLGSSEKAALNKVRPGSRQRNFVTLPSRYSTAEDNDATASSVVAWSFYPKVTKQEGKGWRNIANNQSLALHPTSVNKHSLSADIKYLSFYSIMQSSSKFTNAQETTSVSDFALVLLAGDAAFHMYAGVIVVDGNRLRFKVRDWKTMIALKMLRMKVREALGRVFRNPGRELGDRQRKWMELLLRIFELRQN